MSGFFSFPAIKVWLFGRLLCFVVKLSVFISAIIFPDFGFNPILTLAAYRKFPYGVCVPEYSLRVSKTLKFQPVRQSKFSKVFLMAMVSDSSKPGLMTRFCEYTSPDIDKKSRKE